MVREQGKSAYEQVLTEWKRMLTRSFEPRQWYERDGDDSPPSVEQEEKVMWVYVQSGTGWEVGFFDPQGEFHNDTTWPTKEQAAIRIRWLNGGN